MPANIALIELPISDLYDPYGFKSLLLDS